MQKTFAASLEELNNMLVHICKSAHEAGLNDKQVGQVELAAEEALVNVIKHGYSGSTAEECTIDIECKEIESPHGIEIIIRDKGIAFDPLTKAPPPPNGKPVDEMPIGGYGVFLIKEVMDDVAYRRVDDRNEFTLRKYCDGA